MSRRADASGYTIVEALIFIVVSGLILIAAVAVVGGRQGQVQFEQGVRDLDADIRAVINDVATGYFPDAAFDCTNTPGDNVSIIVPGTGSQGSREACVFAGKAMAIDSLTGYSVVPLAGARMPIGQQLSITTSKLTPIDALTTNAQTSWGLEITGVVDSTGSPISYLAFLGGLNVASDGGGLESGSQSVSAYVGTGDVSNISSANLPLPLASSDAIYFCLRDTDSAAKQRHAVIIVGKDGRQLSTTVDQNAKGEYTAQCGW
jgi:hypothetical protein